MQSPDANSRRGDAEPCLLPKRCFLPQYGGKHASVRDGAVVNVGVSYALPEKYPALGHAARVEVLGTGGVMILDDDHTDQIMYSEIGVPHVYLPDDNVNMVFLQSGTPGDWALGEFWGPIANETRAWLDHLSTGRACTLATPVDARATLEATLAIEHSMRIGAPVTLPLRAG